MRLQGSLASVQGQGSQHRSTLAGLQQQLTQLQQQRGDATNVVATKQALELRRQRAFDAVVASQPVTACLGALRAGIAQQRTALAAEQCLEQRVAASAQQVRSGLQLFEASLGLYEGALSANREAQRVTRAEGREERCEFINEVEGDEWGAENAERREARLRRRELELQSRRDRLINEAQVPAMRAYETIAAAFQAFPTEARARYPQLCAQIGVVAFPRLRGANFGSAIVADIFGTFGAAMNDAKSGCKIRDNFNVVQSCIASTAQQLAYVEAAQGAVAANCQSMTTNLGELDGRRLGERARIFQEVRAQVLSGGTVAGRPPVAVAMAL